MSGYMKESGHYGNVWDEYVTDAFPKIQSGVPHAKRDLEPWRVLNRTDEHYEWPGDEWGDLDDTRRMLDAALPLDDARHLCEFGAGSGRFTQLVLDRYRDANVLSFDVSEKFQAVLRKRFSDAVEAGRLDIILLENHPFQVGRALKTRNLSGKVDAFYSFDALVHVELHTIFIYCLTAARHLKEGGLLAINVADPTSDAGFMKMIADARSVYAKQGGVGGHFMFASPDIMQSMLSRLGFEVAFPEGNGRDLSISARLVDPDRGRLWFERAGSKYFDTA